MAPVAEIKRLERDVEMMHFDTDDRPNFVSTESGSYWVEWTDSGPKLTEYINGIDEWRYRRG